MKALSFLAILLLGSTAFADHRHNNCYSGRSYGNYHGGSSVRISVGSPYYGYGGYGGGYRSYPYRAYPYRAYPYYSGYYRPALGLSYISASPAYYGSYSRRYADADSGSSIEADVQRALKRHGFYRGYVDGDIGPESRSAIRAYQNDHGLSVTGRIDGTLLRSLGI